MGFLGLHAKGLPSGAQQLPLASPCFAVKLQSSPLFKDLQDSKASGGGLWPPSWRGACCAFNAPQAVSAATAADAISARMVC